jgi:hypothetical protein
LPNKKIGQRLARFRQVNMDNPVVHHDALEFPDGQVVLGSRLIKSTIRELRQDRQRPSSFARACRSVLRCA